ncbi:hypothetical protein VTK26DRAFT_4227 [Humicola hyalothermophila]
MSRYAHCPCLQGLLGASLVPTLRIPKGVKELLLVCGFYVYSAIVKRLRLPPHSLIWSSSVPSSGGKQARDFRRHVEAIIWAARVPFMLCSRRDRRPDFLSRKSRCLVC